MGINEVNGVSTQQQTQATNPVKQYDTKEKRKAAINQAIKDYMTYNKMTEKEATKAAKVRVENETNKEEFETFNSETTVYADKKAYKKAKKAQEKAEKEFVKNRAKGVSKKEARKQFEAQQGNKIELAGISARRGFNRLGLVETDGTLGKKAQNFMIDQANILTDEGEEVNYRFDLKERRIARAEINGSRKKGQKKVTVNQLGQMADAVHLNKEKNLTTPIRLATAGAIIGTSYATAYALGGIGTASGSAAAAESASASAASVVAEGGGATAAASAAGAGSAAAGAFAGIGPAALGTAGTPLAALGLLLSDKGKKVKHVVAFNKPEPPKPEPKPEVKPEPKPEPKPEVKPEPCPDEFEDAYCKHKVKYGDNWYNVAKASYTINGKKLEDGSKELKAIIKAQQLMYGIENNKSGKFFKVGDEYKLYKDYSPLFENEEIMKKYPQLQILKDAQIEVDCDAKYKAGKVVKGKFGLVTSKGVDLQNVYDCNGNKKGTRVVNQ